MPLSFEAGDFLVRLDQDIHTLRTVARNGRCGDAVQTAISRANQRIFAAQGRNIDETDGRTPWGRYSRDRGPSKGEGQTYTLIDTSDLIFSLIDVYTMHRLQTEREMEFGSNVEYAEHVHERYGAVIGLDSQIGPDVHRAVAQWWLADSRLPWQEVAG